jgi:DnaJ-domain-containing protein 1
LPIDAELSVQQQLLAGICTRIAAIPNIKETCNNKPASNITFQIDLSAFKKEYLASQFAQFSVDEASLAFQEKDSKLIYFRQGYSISDILSFFCAIHISDCKIDNHQNSQLSLPDNASERFLEGLLEHAEGILSKIKIEEDQKKIMDTLKSKNYFEVLGVTFETSEADIRAAYKALARKYHPDKYQGDKAFATEALQYINTAYEVLSDDSKRKEHEHSLNPNIPNSNSGIHFQNGQGFQFSFGGGGGSFSFSFKF